MRTLLLLDLVVLSSTVVTFPCLAQERRIKRSALPAAVEQTLAKQIEGATIRGFSKEEENGHTLFEAELTVNGHTKDISVDSAGNVVEVEEEVAFDALPRTVKEGLRRKAGKGKITKVETLTKRNKLVAFEAKVMTDGHTSEVQVGPDGGALDHEE